MQIESLNRLSICMSVDLGFWKINIIQGDSKNKMKKWNKYFDILKIKETQVSYSTIEEKLICQNMILSLSIFQNVNVYIVI